jgi:sulfur carrier protein ThiS
MAESKAIINHLPLQTEMNDQRDDQISVETVNDLLIKLQLNINSYCVEIKGDTVIFTKHADMQTNLNMNDVQIITTMERK